MTLNEKTLRQFVSYVFVGGTAAICEWSAFAFCDLYLKFYYILSVILSFVLATFVNLLLGKKLTFRGSVIGKGKEAFLIYFVSAVGLGLNLLLMTLFVQEMHWNSILSKIISTGIVFFWNYFSRRWGVYRDILSPNTDTGNAK